MLRKHWNILVNNSAPRSHTMGLSLCSYPYYLPDCIWKRKEFKVPEGAGALFWRQSFFHKQSVWPCVTMDCWEILLKDTIRHLWRGEGKWKKECFLPYQWTRMSQSSAIPTLQGAQEDYLQDLAASGPQPLPTVAQDVKLRNWGCENTGYWPQIVEMYMKEWFQWAQTLEFSLT